MISFNTEDIKFTLKNKPQIKKWVVSIIEKKHKAGDISFTFCSDEFLLGINKQYLNHNTYTDIITFDYSEDNTGFSTPLEATTRGNKSKATKVSVPISGDIFISIDRVKENAEKFSKSFEDELHRVIIHGVLHLLGYKDKTKIAKAEMTKQEDLCLKAFQKIK